MTIIACLPGLQLRCPGGRKRRQIDFLINHRLIWVRRVWPCIFWFDRSYLPYHLGSGGRIWPTQRDLADEWIFQVRHLALPHVEIKEVCYLLVFFTLLRRSRLLRGWPQ